MNAQIIFCILLLLKCILFVPLSEENNMPGKLCPMPESLDNIGSIFCCLDATQNNSTNTFFVIIIIMFMEKLPTREQCPSLIIPN